MTATSKEMFIEELANIIEILKDVLEIDKVALESIAEHSLDCKAKEIAVRARLYAIDQMKPFKIHLERAQKIAQEF